MTWIDYGIIAIIVVSALTGLIRGFVKEVISILVWIIAIIIAVRFSVPLSQLFQHHIAALQLRIAISFVILIVVTLIIGALLNYLLSQLVNKTGLGGTNRTIGFVFGLLRGLIIVCVLLMLAEFTPIPHSLAWQHSVLVRELLPIALWLKSFLPAQYAAYLTAPTVVGHPR